MASSTRPEHEKNGFQPSHNKPIKPQLKVNGLVSPELAAAVRVCIRSYGVGYVFATAPKLIRTLVSFLTNPRKATPKGSSPIVAFIQALFAVLKDGTSANKDGMSMLLMITLGGYKLLEVLLNRGLKKAVLAQHLQRQQDPQLALLSSSKDDDDPKYWTKNDVDKIELSAGLRQRITMVASFLSSAAAITFMHRYRPRHATIDYSLFAVVRALDVLGHVAVNKHWGPSWLRSYGAVVVFVLACTEIMFSWLYEPQRLPGPYAFWITKMSHMDKRLLQTLREVRAGKLTFNQPGGNDPEVITRLTTLCSELGLEPSMGDLDRLDVISCEVVHQGVTKSCEVHTGYRWLQGFMVSTGIYLPVHLLPALLSPKTFFGKLQSNPIATVSSTLFAAARSSAFLATYIALIWYGICGWRSRIMPAYMKLTGRRYNSGVVDNIYGPLLGSFMCGFSVLIEKPHRRAEMALYVLPRAMYSMWSRVMSGRLSRNVEMAGETVMYGLSMSILLTAIIWRRNNVRPSMQGLLGWMLEIPRPKKQRGEHHGKGKAVAEKVAKEAVSQAVESSSSSLPTTVSSV